jgi:hypothetical protein
LFLSLETDLGTERWGEFSKSESLLRKKGYTRALLFSYCDIEIAIFSH